MSSSNTVTASRHHKATEVMGATVSTRRQPKESSQAAIRSSHQSPFDSRNETRRRMMSDYYRFQNQDGPFDRSPDNISPVPSTSLRSPPYLIYKIPHRPSISGVTGQSSMSFTKLNSGQHGKSNAREVIAVDAPTTRLSLLRSDKKRRFFSPAAKSATSKQLIQAKASVSHDHDYSTVNPEVVQNNENNRQAHGLHDRNSNAASIFRPKPTSNGIGIQKLRANAPAFVPGKVHVPSIRRADNFSTTRSEATTNVAHPMTLDESRKAPSTFTIAGLGRDGPRSHHLKGQQDALWTSATIPTSAQNRSTQLESYLHVTPDAHRQRKGSPMSPLPASKSPRGAYSFECEGVKVTMIDEISKVFVVDLVSRKDCEQIRSLTEEHIAQVEKEGDKSKSWRCLYTYTKMDLPCSEVASLSVVTEKIMKKLVRIVGKVYGRPKAASKLKPRSWKEPHLLMYQKVKDQPEHTGIEMHYDGCDITWQLMLTDLNEYHGGGTYIRTLRKTIMLRQGQVLIHPGELYHKGVDITSGTRFLMVCFMDGFNSKVSDLSRSHDDCKEFEKNVCFF